MNGHTRVRTLAALAAVVTRLGAGSAAAQGRQAASPVPDGFVTYMVFMQNGIFDPSVPSDDTAEFYQKSIKGRNNQEVAAHRAEAADYLGRSAVPVSHHGRRTEAGGANAHEGHHAALLLCRVGSKREHLLDPANPTTVVV